MTAEKIVKINSEHEVEYLKERINLLESVIDYSLAETVQELKSRVKNLENEAIALRAADSEKDKMITEKNNQIAEIKKKVDGDNAVAESARATLTSLRRLSLINALVLPELLFLRMDCFKTCIYTVSKSIAAIEKSSKLK